MQRSDQLARAHFADAKKHLPAAPVATIQLRNHPYRSPFQLGHGLHVRYVRPARQDQLYRIVDAGCVIELLIVAAVRHAAGQDVAMRADRDREHIRLSGRVEKPADVELHRREAGQMLARELAVQEDPRPVHGLVELQPHHLGIGPVEGETATIPKCLPVLVALLVADVLERRSGHVG